MAYERASQPMSPMRSGRWMAYSTRERGKLLELNKDASAVPVDVRAMFDWTNRDPLVSKSAVLRAATLYWGLKLLYPGRFDRVSVGIYLAMGWSGVMLYGQVVKALPALVLGFILAGGLLYSFGVVFHAWRRLRFQNAIWHGFVLAGAACHYTAVLDLVLS